VLAVYHLEGYGVNRPLKTAIVVENVEGNSVFTFPLFKEDGLETPLLITVRWSGGVFDGLAVLTDAISDLEVVHLTGMAPERLPEEFFEIVFVTGTVLNVAGMFDVQDQLGQQELALGFVANPA
jgi:hypothetical protein